MTGRLPDAAAAALVVRGRAFGESMVPEDAPERDLVVRLVGASFAHGYTTAVEDFARVLASENLLVVLDAMIAAKKERT